VRKSTLRRSLGAQVRGDYGGKGGRDTLGLVVLEFADHGGGGEGAGGGGGVVGYACVVRVWLVERRAS
jgi:hypothetical protein